MVQQILEQGIRYLHVAIDLLKCKSHHERIRRGGGTHLEEDLRSFSGDLIGFITIEMHPPNNQRKRGRRTPRYAGPAVDQERFLPGRIGEGEDSPDVVGVGEDEGLLVFLADSLGADDVVADDAVDLAETGRIDRSPIWLADGDEVPEVGFVLCPSWEIGLRADGKVAEMGSGNQYSKSEWREIGSGNRVREPIFKGGNGVREPIFKE